MISSSARNSILLHIFSWIVLMTLWSLLPSPRFISHPELFRTCQFLIVLCCFYLNFTLLFNTFNGSRSIYYLLAVLVLLLMAFGLCYLIGYLLMEEPPFSIPRPEFDSHGPQRKRPNFEAVASIGTTLMSLGAILIGTLLRQQQTQRRKESELASMKTMMSLQELNFLRQQMNPHFLFNALNNIYSMAVNKSDDTGKVIIKLSEMLRYTIYDINEDKVALTKEIRHIQNFIELQKLKDPSSHGIEFIYEEHNVKISPMLLIVFVENAFKHGKIDQEVGGWIHISLKVAEGSLHFEVANSLHSREVRGTSENNGGIGIDNVRKRLELIYPGKHELDLIRAEGSFTVKLKIKL